MPSERAWQLTLVDALTAAGLDGGSMLVGAPGVYRFVLPRNAWINIDAAKSATHAAESKLSNGDIDGAAGEAFVAKLITERQLLPGISGPWLESRRAQLQELRIRALHCSARTKLARRSFPDAARDAERAVEIAPLSEASWWLLMDTHTAGGDLASAIHAYERCRSTLDTWLGITPSAATRDRHSALLAQTCGPTPGDALIDVAVAGARIFDGLLALSPVFMIACRFTTAHA